MVILAPIFPARLQEVSRGKESIIAKSRRYSCKIGFAIRCGEIIKGIREVRQGTGIDSVSQLEISK